ncbi:MAG TPA: HEAT repeat domain-containing protein [Anaeromyxobacter sp.]|nr:HEAT repeat domain-containing protein [Anaeromyxobacter sp.]
MRLAAALVVASLAACSRGPGKIHVRTVRVADGAVTPALREVGIDEAALDDAARAALRSAGFAFGEGARPHIAEVSGASVRLAAPNASGGAPRLEIAVEVALVPTDGGEPGAVRETGTAAAPVGGGDPATAARAALAEAAQRAAESLLLGFAEEAKPIDKLVGDLESRDPRVRDHAVRVLADRRGAASAAVPALIARLKDEDPRVVHRAVGALAQIGDARAVGPLIDLSRNGDAALAARVARLIGDIGGPEAEGYLLTLEAGHPDPRVRKAAREALGEMRARAEQGGALSARK